MSDNFDLGKGGVKFDAGKVRMDLVPMDAVFGAAAVFTYGAIKYDDWNWAKGMRRGRILAAMMRHVTAYLLGEELDDESGLPHTWHISCCALMLSAADLRMVSIEDRLPAQRALERAQHFFKGMKDPGGTAKNAGGTIVDVNQIPPARGKTLGEIWNDYLCDDDVIGLQVETLFPYFIPSIRGMGPAPRGTRGPFEILEIRKDGTFRLGLVGDHDRILGRNVWPDINPDELLGGGFRVVSE